MQKVRQRIRQFDKFFLFSMVSKLKKLTSVWILKKSTSRKFSASFTIHTDLNSELSTLCDLFGSDKGSNFPDGHPFPWKPHLYADFYQLLLSSRRLNIHSVFECGIGSSDLSISANMGAEAKAGASLRVWREFFPNACIYGGDIDEKVIFQEERIVTFCLDQTDPNSISEVFADFDEKSFDLIIDDGLHTYDAGLTLFLNINHTLADDGYYIIEDVTPRSMRKFIKKFKSFSDYCIKPIVFHEKDNFQELNSLLLITRKH